MVGDRTLLLSSDPVNAWRARRAAGWSGRVYLSNLRAAEAFDVEGLPTTTLERWATAAPARIATPFARRRALLAAIGEVGIGGERDVAGYASVAAGAVRELLRHADLEAPPAALDPRLARWWRVAARYRALLAEQGVIDPAEALRRATDRLGHANADQTHAVGQRLCQALADGLRDEFRRRVDGIEGLDFVQAAVVPRFDNRAQVVLQFVEVHEQAIAIEGFASDADRDAPVVAVDGLALALHDNGVGSAEDGFEGQAVAGHEAVGHL